MAKPRAQENASEAIADDRRILGDYQLGSRIYRHDVDADVEALAAAASPNELRALTEAGVIEGNWIPAAAAEENETDAQA